MRNPLLLCTAAVLLSACADNQNATAPVSRPSSSSSSATGDVTTTGIRVPDAKPVDQVGFTQVTRVNSPNPESVVAGQTSAASVACPAGSTAIGGHYNISLYIATATPPWVRFSGLNGLNEYTVSFANEQCGGSSFTYTVTVYCAS